MSDIKSAAQRAAERINAKVAGYSGSIVGSFQDWMEAVILEETKDKPSPETPRDDLWKFICDVVCDPEKSWPKAAEIIREEVLRRASQNKESPNRRHDFDSEWLNYHDYIKSVAKAEYHTGSSLPAAIELATDNARHVFG